MSVATAILGLWMTSLDNAFAQESDAALNIEVDDFQAEAEPIDIPADAVDLPPEVFDNVSTRSIGISLAESPAYYAILNHAKVLTAEKLTQAARQQREIRYKVSPLFKDKPVDQFLPFVDLFKHPDAYIGKTVTLTGYTRRLNSISADPNPYGIKTLYELWLFTDDSQNNPLVIVCTDIPDDLPRGDDLINGISVTGYFFKLYGYDAEDSKRLAPMILAHNVTWNPPRTLPPPVSPWILYPAALLGIGLLLFVLWFMAYRDRVNSPLKRVTLHAPEQLSWPANAAERESSNSSSPDISKIIEQNSDRESDTPV
ncbi:MAG: hypothetical protein O3A29_06430 [Planctomycetota bacterium]|nr:hypothetical protein [Planctomycetota bacterium]